MAKKPTITSITSGYASTNTLNDNFEALRDAFDNTLSLDGSTPNSMTSDLNLNNNDILNASRILVGGVDYIATALSYKNDAETAKTAAEAAQAAAELAYDNFDDRYLGAKSSDPTVDNDGNALLDGALYYDIANTVMKFYDTSTSTWYRTTPTTSDQANIDIVAGNTTNINTVAGISANVTTVAGISSDVTTVAGQTTNLQNVTDNLTAIQNASTNATNAAASATSAASSATSASNSASTATTQASNAATSASNASTSETNSASSAASASTSATNASTSETNAATSASNASTSETNAASSATSAAASAAAAAASADFFDDVYLGSKASDPSTDNDGDALNAGDLYFNTTSNNLKVYSGSAWQDAAVDSSGFVQTTGDTMTGNLDVQGTVTADGLTVDATESYINGRLRLESGANSQDLRFSDTSTTDQNQQLRLSSGSLLVQSQNNAFNAATTRAAFANNGDVSFYEDTGTTAKLFWDASAERLGIGTSAPHVGSSSYGMHIKAPAGKNSEINLDSSDTSTSGWIQFTENGTGQWRIAYDPTANHLEFTESGVADRMVIQDGGNVGIGTTSPSFNSGTGLEISRSGTASLRVERTGATASSGEFFAGNGQVVVNSVSNTPLIFRTNNTDRMRIDSSGNVGIGVVPEAISTYTNVQAQGSSQGGIFTSTTSGGHKARFYVTTTAGYVGTVSNQDFIFLTNDSERLRIDSSGNVGINGSPSPSDGVFRLIQIGGANKYATFGAQANGGFAALMGSNFYYNGGWKRTDAGRVTKIETGPDSSSEELFSFQYAGDGAADSAITWSEAMRIDSSGNLLVGTTSAQDFTSTTTNGHTFYGASVNAALHSRNNANALAVQRTGTDGSLVNFFKDTATVGSISSRGGEFIAVGSGDTFLEFNFGSDQINPSSGTAARDNAIDLGSSGARFDDIYATNGTIQTSDRNEKQDIAELSEAEQRVAVAAKGLLRKFRWKDAVAEKGDEARTHFGIIAQDLQAAFAAEGLDAGDYAMFIHTTWTDEETGEERSRMGVRYSELLAFIIAAI